MTKETLKKFVAFVPGINSFRAESQYGKTDIQYYSSIDFEKDCCFDNNQNRVKICKKSITGDFELQETDIVISNISHKAAVVGKNSVGKTLSSNFTKVIFKNNSVDKLFFVYWFNCSVDLKKQKNRVLQGSSIVKLTNRSLENFLISIPSTQQQKAIGEIYRETLILQNKINTYANIIEVFTNTILNQVIEEGAENER